MAEPSAAPALTPQFCFSSVALRDFLRLSRSTIDDAITQNLNALYTPAQAGFDPQTTRQRAPRASDRRLDTAPCTAFRDNVLLASWQSRSDVLNYCSSVATSPDPEDPEAAQRELESTKNKEQVVDERLDPYSARYFPQEPRTERLAALLRQERSVERIVRSRSWDLYRERCGDPVDAWQDALEKWRETR